MIMKTYNIILTVTFVLTLYMWIYDRFLYEKTYVQYLPNYQEEVAYPTYSPNHDGEKKVDNWTENVPAIGMVLFKLFPIVILAVYIMFVAAFIYGCLLFFSRRRYLNFKWWIAQLILYGIIVWFILKTPLMD